MKTYKVLFSAPTITNELMSTTLEVGESKQYGKWSVCLKSIISEPTSDHTGSAWVETVSEFGKKNQEISTLAKNHGGARQGSGRPQTDRNFAISVRISAEAKAILDKQRNKAEYIDNIIKQNP